jgi:hypothetical protein
MGRFVGTQMDSSGNTRNIASTVRLPVDPSLTTATCSVLHLVLGPLNLNLLGLVIHLNQVVLDISAQSGPGNLLGNLLCNLSNALSSSSLANAAILLNDILALL